MTDHNRVTHIMVLGIMHDSVINAIVQTFSIAMFDQPNNQGDLTTEHALWMIRWLNDYGTANDTRLAHPISVLLDDIMRVDGPTKIESEPIRKLMNEFVEDSLEKI